MERAGSQVVARGGTARLLAARSRAHLGLLAALTAIVAIVVATWLAGSADVARRSGEAASRALSQARSSDGALVLQTRAGPDRAEQEALVPGLLVDAAGDGAGAVSVVGSTYAEALTAAGADGGSLGAIVPAVLADLPEHAELVAGRWPGDAGAIDPDALPGVLPAAEADALGITVGDVLRLGRAGGVAVELVGTYAPRDASDPRWVGARAADLSGTSDAVGPLVLAGPADLDVLPGTPFVRWTLVPSGTPVATADLPGLAEALTGLPDALAAALEDRLGGAA
ncbi:MAG TPA: hypothetical protein DHV14_08960, partial [Micrococcales bacterium]|nr:hypothetical protein [Micrococcales bacterium]